MLKDFAHVGLSFLAKPQFVRAAYDELYIAWNLYASIAINKFRAGEATLPNEDQITTNKAHEIYKIYKIYKSFIFFWRFIEIYQDLLRFIMIFIKILLRFLLTRLEFVQGFFSFTESLLELSYQIALIYQNGQVFDDKPRYMWRFMRYLERFIGICKDLWGL